MALPKKLIVLQNPDKVYQKKDVWTPDRDPLDLPNFRMVISGGVNMGKTNIIKNIIARTDYDEIYLLHCDPKTKEYEDCDVEVLEKLPPIKFWSDKAKKLVILDDIEYNDLPKDQKSRLDRLLGHVSTHKNASVILTCQEWHNVFPSLRRMCNFYILFRSNDLGDYRAISRKCGINPDLFQSIFDSFSNRRDSLWIDLTEGTPYPLRKNGYEILDKEDFM